MAIINFPTNIFPVEESWEVLRDVSMLDSSISKDRQVKVKAVNRWKAKLVFSDLMEDQKRYLQSFLYQLRGVSGKFYLSPFSKKAELTEVVISDYLESDFWFSLVGGTSQVTTNTDVYSAVSTGDILLIKEGTESENENIYFILEKIPTNILRVDKSFVADDTVKFRYLKPLNKVKVPALVNNISKGSYFSINNELKVVTQDAAAGTDVILSFYPPIRNIYSGTTETLIFDEPKCIMSLASNEVEEMIEGIQYWDSFTLECAETGE